MVERRREAAIAEINLAASKAASAELQPEKHDARLQFFQAVQSLISSFDGVSAESKNLLHTHVRALDRLSKGRTPAELKPVRDGKKRRFDYYEWNRRALFKYCYDVLRDAGHRKPEALDKIQTIAKQVGVQLPRSGLEQAIINNFSYKKNASDKDKSDAIFLYERMCEEYEGLFGRPKMTREQGIIWCRRTLQKRKQWENFTRRKHAEISSEFVLNGELVYLANGVGSAFLLKRGDDGVLVRSYDDPDLIGAGPLGQDEDV